MPPPPVQQGQLLDVISTNQADAQLLDQLDSALPENAPSDSWTHWPDLAREAQQGELVLQATSQLAPTSLEQNDLRRDERDAVLQSLEHVAAIRAVELEKEIATALAHHAGADAEALSPFLHTMPPLLEDPVNRDLVLAWQIGYRTYLATVAGPLDVATPAPNEIRQAVARWAHTVAELRAELGRRQAQLPFTAARAMAYGEQLRTINTAYWEHQQYVLNGIWTNEVATATGWGDGVTTCWKRYAEHWAEQHLHHARAQARLNELEQVIRAAADDGPRLAAACLAYADPPPTTATTLPAPPTLVERAQEAHAVHAARMEAERTLFLVGASIVLARRIVTLLGVQPADLRIHTLAPYPVVSTGDQRCRAADTTIALLGNCSWCNQAVESQPLSRFNPLAELGEHLECLVAPWEHFDRCNSTSEQLVAPVAEQLPANVLPFVLSPTSGPGAPPLSAA